MSIDSYIHQVSPGTQGGTLAFIFHGTGGSETQMMPLARDLMPDATLIAPRGDVDEAGAHRFFRRKAEGLYDMADLARATGKMGAFVAAHVSRVRPTRIIGLGYSNGANILASVIFAKRALFDDAVLLHPLIAWEPEGGVVRTRVLVTAGERDPICPPALTRQLIDWFDAQGAPVAAHWHSGGHSVEHSELQAITAFLAAPDVAKTKPPH